MPSIVIVMLGEIDNQERRGELGELNRKGSVYSGETDKFHSLVLLFALFLLNRLLLHIGCLSRVRRLVPFAFSLWFFPTN